MAGCAPFCCVLVLVWFFKRLPQEWSYLSFHLFTCTMGFAPIKWTCTAFFRPRQLTDRAILAIRQTQEKKNATCSSTLTLAETKKRKYFFLFSQKRLRRATGTTRTSAPAPLRNPFGSSCIGSSCVTIYHCSVGQSLLVCKLRLCVSFGFLCIARVVPVRLV